MLTLTIHIVVAVILVLISMGCLYGSYRCRNDEPQGFAVILLYGALIAGVLAIITTVEILSIARKIDNLPARGISGD